MNREHFIEAKHAYQNTIEILNKTLEIFNQNVPEDKRVEPRAFQIKFDLLLQHSLINIAISDEDMFSDELVLIHDITDIGDIVLFFRDVYKSEITWEQLYKMNPSEVAKMLKEQEENMSYLGDDFVKVVSIVDAVVTDYDIAQMLFHEISNLVKILMVLDGDVKEDLDKVNNSFILHLFNEVASRREKIRENCSSEAKEEECSNQSLEDIFNKKRK